MQNWKPVMTDSLKTQSFSHRKIMTCKLKLMSYWKNFQESETRKSTSGIFLFQRPTISELIMALIKNFRSESIKRQNLENQNSALVSKLNALKSSDENLRSKLAETERKEDNLRHLNTKLVQRLSLFKVSRWNST